MTTHFQTLLPVLVVQGHYTPFFLTVCSSLMWGLNVLAVGALVRSDRGRTVLQLGLCVSMAATALGITLLIVAAARYTVGWYAARLDALVSAGIILWVLFSELRRLYATLGASEQRFRAAFDVSATGMMLTGLDRRLLRVNPALCHLLGYTAAELNALSPGYHAPRRSSREPRPAALPAVGTTADRAEGETLPAQGWPYPMGRGDPGPGARRGRDPLHVTTQVHDITDRKRVEEALHTSEERFRLLAENATDMIARLSPEDLYLYVSTCLRAAARLCAR